MISDYIKVFLVLVLQRLWQSKEFTVHDSVIEMHLHVSFVHGFALPGHSEEANSIPDQLTFDLLVERTVGREARAMIHLQEIRFCLFIEHNVES